MDWKYKHFNEMAVFNAPRQNVLDAAREVVAESLEGIEDTADGFVARGYGAWHAAQATVHIMPVPNGTQVAIELLVERAAMRGYMLFDVGGYYTGQIDKWFSKIGQRLGDTPEKSIVSKSTADYRIRQGCLAGCLVYLLVGACLAAFAIPLDSALFPRSSGSLLGPFGIAASLIGLFAGVLVFVYLRYPEAPVSKSIRARLPRIRK